MARIIREKAEEVSDAAAWRYNTTLPLEEGEWKGEESHNIGQFADILEVLREFHVQSSAGSTAPQPVHDISAVSLFTFLPLLNA